MKTIEIQTADRFKKIKVTQTLQRHLAPRCDDLVRIVLAFGRLEISLLEQTHGKSSCGFGDLKCELQNLIEENYFSPSI
jgi:hypothetical protein